MLGGRPCSVTLQKRGVFSASGTNQKCSKLHLGIDPRDDGSLRQFARPELTPDSAQARNSVVAGLWGPHNDLLFDHT